MKMLTPLFALVFLAGSASAHEAPCDPQKKAAKATPGAKAAAKAPPKRRPVRQVIEPTQRIAPVVTEGYRPTLNRPSSSTMAGVPGAAPALPSSMPPPTVPPPPVQIGTCGAGGCTDTSGTRYTGGVGTTVLDPQGRNCTRTGTTVQCF